jgi:hypothetical protein
MQKVIRWIFGGVLAVAGGVWAEPALTIYNQNFAVVRDSVPLDLKPGVNEVRFSGATAHLEPESVMLRDPSGKTALRILEQNYRNDPLSQALLLSLSEGQTIDFIVTDRDGAERTVAGKIVRSGYAVHSQQAMQRYGQRYAMTQHSLGGGYFGGGSTEPIIETDGKLRFGLPGRPVFPSLGDDTVLKPTLTWLVEAGIKKPVQLTAELAYVSGGMSWSADYNATASETGDALDLVGWVTMDNQSGKTFENASVKLMAGDVSKLQDERQMLAVGLSRRMDVKAPFAAPQVTEKTFDEYHLYTLQRPCTLRDRETKQVEFIRAAGVKAQKIYVYDGAVFDWNRWRGHNPNALRRNSEFGEQSHTKVAVMREFKNDAANKLGIPLPKGRIRFYVRDGEQLEFTGENQIDHTPKDEWVKVYTGEAFDLAAARRRVDFRCDNNADWAEEEFSIVLRNHKTEPVEIRVVEHLYRWTNWEIIQKSDPFTKVDAQEIQFRVTVKPDEEKTVTYRVRYTW